VFSVFWLFRDEGALTCNPESFQFSLQNQMRAPSLEKPVFQHYQNEGTSSRSSIFNASDVGALTAALCLTWKKVFLDQAHKKISPEGEIFIIINYSHIKSQFLIHLKVLHIAPEHVYAAA